LESRIKKKVPVLHRLFYWLIEHAAWLLTIRTRVNHNQEKPTTEAKRTVNASEPRPSEPPTQKTEKSQGNAVIAILKPATVDMKRWRRQQPTLQADANYEWNSNRALPSG